MYSFKYQAAGSVSEATEAMRSGDDVKFLAGGQTLLASLKLRMAQPSLLVDLQRVAELKGIRVNAGREVVVGAMTTHHEVATSELLLGALPSLSSLASHIGDPMIRRRGTLGGSLANNDPAADYPAAVMALDATIKTSTRSIPADKFIRGMFETALAQDELLLEVSFRIPKRAAYVKFKHPASRFAIVGVYVAEFDDGIRVAVTGAGPCAFRSAPMEAALRQRFDPSAIDALTIDPEGLNSDLQATANYRAQLVKVISKRAVAATLGN